MKKVVITFLLLFMSIGATCSSTVYAADKYKNTSYKSFDTALRKSYEEEMTSGMRSGILYAYAKLKTPYGLKKALVVRNLGTTDDCATVKSFIKIGNKIKQNDTGLIVSRSSADGKYVFVPGVSIDYDLYKYVNGTYKLYRSTDPELGATNAPKMSEKTMIKKYKLKEVSWKEYKPQKTVKKRKIPNKIYGSDGNLLAKTNLVLRYKKNYLYLKGYYRTSWSAEQRYSIDKKFEVSSKCKVLIRTDSRIQRKVSFKKYIKEEYVMKNDRINYIGCQITIKNNKVTQILFGD